MNAINTIHREHTNNSKSAAFTLRLLPSPAGRAELAPERDIPATGFGSSGSFHLYLREIGQVKLLTPEEENTLAERVKAGDEDAREQMIKANLRLVVKIARDYEGLGLPLLDLVGEGNIGLMKGVERFRPEKGAKLSTYAAWWIKQAIKRALANQSKIIRLPVHVTHTVSNMHKASIKLRETLNREATDEELAEDLELNPRRIRQYRDISRSPMWLDCPITNDDSTPFSETVADENSVAPFDDLLKDNDNDMLYEVLASLDERERKILTMRFGLDGGAQKTLEDIGAHFGITRERIRQIQEEALEKMRKRIQKRDPLSITERVTPVTGGNLSRESENLCSVRRLKRTGAVLNLNRSSQDRVQ